MDLVATLKLNADEYLRGIDQAARGWDDFSKNIDQANRDWSSYAGDLMAGGAALTAAVTLPIAGVGVAALKMASEFEQAEIAFTTMLGSGQKSKTFLDELKAFAASTPFEFPELQNAAKKMMALGFESHTVIPIMRTLGDAVAGLGGNSALIDRITLQLGQMMAKGKVAASEMKVLAEAGIPAWELLAKKIGVSIPQAMKMAETGAISSAQAIPAILEGMNERFGGMMAQQAQTALGKFSNLKDQISFILADLGKSLIPFANSVLEMAKPILEVVQSVVDGFAGLPAPVQAGIVAFTALAAAAGPVLLAIGGIIQALTALAPVLGAAGIGSAVAALGTAFGAVALAVAAVVAAFELWKLAPVQSAVKSLWDTVTGFWNETLKPFVDAVVNGGQAFATFAAGVAGSGLAAAWEAISGAASKLWDWLKQVWAALGELGNAFMSVLDALSPLLSPLGDIVEWLGKLYVVLATGGLIAAWELLKAVLGFVLELFVDVARILGGALLTGLRGLASLVATIGDALGKTLKPVLAFVIGQIEDLIGWLRRIPGVKTALDAVNGAFDKIKSSVAGATGETKKLNDETDKSKQATTGAANAAKQYSGGLDEVRRSMEAKSGATGKSAEETKKLEAAHKATESAVKNTSNALGGIMTNLDRSKGSVNDLTTAQNRLSDLQTKLTQQFGTDMPPAIRGMYLQVEIAKQKAEELKATAERLELERLFDAASRSVQAHTQNLRTFVRDHAELLATATASSLRQLNASIDETRRADDEFKRIHGASRQELEQRASQAERDYARIAQAANHTNAQIDAAERDMLRARIAMHEATGQAISQADRTRLAELEGNLKGHTEKSKTMWDVLANQVSTIFTDLSKSLTDRFFSIVSGEGGWEGMKQNALGILDDIGKAITRFGVESLEAYFMDQLKKITKDLLPDLKEVFTNIFTQNGGVWKAVTGLFDHLGDLFKKTKDAVIDIGTEGLAQLSGWGIGGAGSAAGSAGGAVSGGGGAAGSAAGAVGSGITGLVGAISSAATAISSIVGNFQMAGMNRTLDLIEKEVRYSQIHLNYILDRANAHLPKLDGVETFNYGVVAPSWYDLLSHLDNYLPKYFTALDTDLPGDLNEIRTSVENTKGTIEIMQDAITSALSGLVAGFGEKLAPVTAGFKTALDITASNLQSTLREIVNSDFASRNSITSALSMLGGDVRNVQNAIYQSNMAPAMLSELGMIRGELIQIKSLSQTQISAKPTQLVVNVTAPPGTSSPQNFGYMVASTMRSQGVAF